MTLARSFTKKLKRGLSIRSSTILEKPGRPTISLPLERLADDPTADVVKRHTLYQQDVAAVSPSSPTSSSSTAFSSPTSSRASSSSRSSYNSGDECYFTAPVKFEKRVSFQVRKVIPRRASAASTDSSVYAADGELPPPFEDDEHIMQQMGKFRFSAAEYIQEIEGTPMILVDGKLYL
jgi:hypothetical protein